MQGPGGTPRGRSWLSPCLGLHVQPVKFAFWHGNAVQVWQVLCIITKSDLPTVVGEASNWPPNPRLPASTSLNESPSGSCQDTCVIAEPCWALLVYKHKEAKCLLPRALAETFFIAEV